MVNEKLNMARMTTYGIDNNCQKIIENNILICLWVSPRNNIVAAGFSGRRRKADFFYKYSDEEKRNIAVNKYLESQKEQLADKEKRKAEKLSYQHDYKIGDILYSSWGYDQTNVDFYQVVAVPSSKSIKIRQLAREIVHADNSMSSDVIALKDNFISDEVMKRVKLGGIVKIHDCANAYRWDGKPKYSSSYH